MHTHDKLLCTLQQEKKTKKLPYSTHKQLKRGREKKKPNASSAIVCALSVSNFPDSVVELSCSSIF